MSAPSRYPGFGIADSDIPAFKILNTTKRSVTSRDMPFLASWPLSIVGWWSISSAPASPWGLDERLREHGADGTAALAIALDLEGSSEFLIARWFKRGLGPLPALGEILQWADPGASLASRIPPTDREVDGLARDLLTGPMRRAHCHSGPVREAKRRLRAGVTRQIRRGKFPGEVEYRVWEATARPFLAEHWQPMALEAAHMAEPVIAIAARADDAWLWIELAAVADYWGLSGVSGSFRALAQRLQIQPDTRLRGSMRRLDFLLESGLVDDARQLLGEIGQDPDIGLLDPEYLLARARISLAAEDAMEVAHYREALRAFVQRDRTMPIAAVNEAGHALLEHGDAAEASGLVTVALQSYAGKGRTMPASLGSLVVSVATVLIDSGKLNDAEAMITEALRFDWPGQSGAVMQQALGAVYMARGELERAGAVLRRALEVPEKRRKTRSGAQLQGSLATVFISQGRYDEAQHLLEEAQETWDKLDAGGQRSTDRVQVELLQGLLAQARGQYAAAEIRYRDILADDDLNETVRVTVIRGLGVSLLRLERPEEALAVFGEAADRLATRRADHPDLFLEYARTLAHVAARVDDARRLWEDCAAQSQSIWDLRESLPRETSLGAWSSLNSALAALGDVARSKRLENERRAFEGLRTD